MSRREHLFDAIRPFADRYSDPQTIVLVNKLADHLGLFDEPARGMRPSQKAIDLIHSFESLELDSYKDPGSDNGLPITCGWGSTSDLEGRPIKLGSTWTKEYADAVFARDIEKRIGWLNNLLVGVPTTQHQWDALFSLGYNIGFGPKGLGGSSLLRAHKAGDYATAARKFGNWIYNDGKKLNGLVRRRAAEAALYRGEG